MADNEVTIKISGDSKEVESAFSRVASGADSLGTKLNNSAKTAALAFAGLAAEVTLSVKAFAESEKVSNSLTAAMQNKGIYSKALFENYNQQADALENLTGVNKETTIAAMTTLQAFIGQIPITEKLTKAVADFAAANRLDLNTAAELVGKTMNSNIDLLKRYGLSIDVNASQQD